MPNPAYDRDQLHKLFTGGFGEFTELYGNVVVAGEPPGNLNAIEAIFGFYAHAPRLRFYDISATSVTALWFLRRIPSFKFSDDQADILTEQRRIVRDERPEWLDPASQRRLWRDTQEEFGRLGLPISFFSFQTVAEGRSNVLFWYPRYVLAHAMLHVFKVATVNVRPA